MSEWTIIKGKDGKPSSNIRMARYERSRKHFFVEFVSGSRYVYYDVPWGVYLKFRHAPSKGAYFSRAIREEFQYAQI